MKRNNLRYIISILLAVIVAVSLTACGGGGGGSSSGGSAPVTQNQPSNQNPQPTTQVSSVSGVAAIGAPLAGGSVYVKDANGTQHGPYPIDANGDYSIDVTTFNNPPFYLRAEGAGGNPVLYSVSMNPGTANINPLTNLAVAAAAGVSDPADVYDDPVAHPVAQVELDNAIDDILALLAPILNNPAYNASGINPLTDDDYEADGTGLDGCIDDLDLDIDFDNGGVTIFLNGVQVGHADLDDLENEDDPIEEAEVEDVLTSSASGEGVNYPELKVSGQGYHDQSGPRATLTLDVDLLSLETSTLSYAFNRIAFSSTSITGISVAENTATITGVGTDANSGAGCTFTATVTDNASDAMGIVINPGGACSTSHNADTQTISGGTGYVIEQSGSRASLKVDVNSLSLGTSTLSYSFNRIAFSSTSVTGISVAENTATITGVGTDANSGAGCTFTATVTNDASDAMGIVINPGGACSTSYSAGSLAISGGLGYTVD